MQEAIVKKAEVKKAKRGEGESADGENEESVSAEGESAGSESAEGENVGCKKSRRRKCMWPKYLQESEATVQRGLATYRASPCVQA